MEPCMRRFWMFQLVRRLRGFLLGPKLTVLFRGQSQERHHPAAQHPAPWHKTRLKVHRQLAHQNGGLGQTLSRAALSIQTGNGKPGLMRDHLIQYLPWVTKVLLGASWHNLSFHVSCISSTRRLEPLARTIASQKNSLEQRKKDLESTQKQFTAAKDYYEDLGLRISCGFRGLRVSQNRDHSTWLIVKTGSII